MNLKKGWVAVFTLISFLVTSAHVQAAKTYKPPTFNNLPVEMQSAVTWHAMDTHHVILNALSQKQASTEPLSEDMALSHFSVFYEGGEAFSKEKNSFKKRRLKEDAKANFAAMLDANRTLKQDFFYAPIAQSSVLSYNFKSNRFNVRLHKGRRTQTTYTDQLEYHQKSKDGHIGGLSAPSVSKLRVKFDTYLRGDLNKQSFTHNRDLYFSYIPKNMDEAERIEAVLSSDTPVSILGFFRIKDLNHWKKRTDGFSTRILQHIAYVDAHLTHLAIASYDKNKREYTTLFTIGTEDDYSQYMPNDREYNAKRKQFLKSANSLPKINMSEIDPDDSIFFAPFPGSPALVAKPKKDFGIKGELPSDWKDLLESGLTVKASKLGIK